MAGRIRTEVDGHIGWLVVEQPERRNAVSLEMWQQIPDAAARLDADDDVRVVVVRGAGEEAFVAGADISQFEARRTGDGAAIYEAATTAGYGALAAITKPTIAMVHGPCVGGGLAIALTTDLRVSADDGRFAIPAARSISCAGWSTRCRWEGYRCVSGRRSASRSSGTSHGVPGATPWASSSR